MLMMMMMMMITGIRTVKNLGGWGLWVWGAGWSGAHPAPGLSVPLPPLSSPAP